VHGESRAANGRGIVARLYRSRLIANRYSFVAVGTVYVTANTVPKAMPCCAKNGCALAGTAKEAVYIYRVRKCT